MSDRDERGRFTRGNPGGPGRPRRQTESDYLRAVQEACSLEDFTAIAAQAVNRARQGDTRSREWLSRYLLGAPTFASPRPSSAAIDEAVGRDEVAEGIAMRGMLRGLLSGSESDACA